MASSATPPSKLLRYSLSREQPRIRVSRSPPLSRRFPKLSPSPEALALIADGSYYKVPSKWHPDNRVWSRDRYLSRNCVLKKMIHQRILHRTLEPFDYWVTIPIQPPTRLENADPPELKDVSLKEIEGISIAFATGPVESSPESRTPYPFEIKSLVPLTNLENQTPPLSPQLRYSLISRKVLPRIKVPRILKASFPLSHPETLAMIADGSYNKVPSTWCPDRKIWSRDHYLSRNSLLKKMIHQSILYRTLEPVFHEDAKDEYHMDALGIKVLGMPFDYWVTMPIHPPTRLKIADPPELKDVSLYELEEISIGYAAGPVQSSRYALNRLVRGVGLGQEEPNNDGLPFLWVRNTTGTKLLDRDSVMSLQIEHIIGFVECPDCGKVMCMGCLVPGRFDIIGNSLRSIAEATGRTGENFACKFRFDCRCVGIKNLGTHFISDDLNKINWMFLFLGFGIGYCTVDQLKYYCIQRNLPISDTKNQILVTVFDDLCLQITKRPIVRR